MVLLPSHVEFLLSSFVFLPFSIEHQNTTTASFLRLSETIVKCMFLDGKNRDRGKKNTLKKGDTKKTKRKKETIWDSEAVFFFFIFQQGKRITNAQQEQQPSQQPTPSKCDRDRGKAFDAVWEYVWRTLCVGRRGPARVYGAPSRSSVLHAQRGVELVEGACGRRRQPATRCVHCIIEKVVPQRLSCESGQLLHDVRYARSRRRHPVAGNVRRERDACRRRRCRAQLAP